MNKNSISVSQLFFIVLQTQIGIGVSGLPYNLFKTAHTDGWISMLISGCMYSSNYIIPLGINASFARSNFISDRLASCFWQVGR